MHGSEWHLRGIDYLRARTIGIHRRDIPQASATRVWLRVRATSGGPPFSVLNWIDVVRVGAKLRWLLDKGTEVQLRAHPARCYE